MIIKKKKKKKKKKENLPFIRLYRPGRPLRENQRKTKERQVLSLCQITKKKRALNRNMTVIPVVTDALGTISKGFVKGLEEFRNQGRAETI